MKLSKDKTKVLILSHFLINPFQNNSAASTAMAAFLKDKVKKVVQIEHPFPDSKDNHSYISIYKNGELKIKKKEILIKKPDWVSYILQTLTNISYFLEYELRYDLGIVCENLSFISVWPLRKLGLVKKLIYYSVDYVEIRFQNPLLNKMYHTIDRFACKYSDENWVTSEAQIKGRESNGIDLRKCSPFKIVPIGFRLSEINISPMTKSKYYNLVFCGTLRESAGPQLIIESLPFIIQNFPKVVITFVGSGEYKKYLLKLATKLGVKKYIKFLTNVKNHKRIIQILTNCSIGFAPYAPVPESISYRSDPGKIKLYLACGLPVITTRIATSHKVIASNKAGVVIDYNEGDLSKAVSRLLGNKDRYEVYRKRAILLSKRYDADRILSHAFRSTIRSHV